MTVIGLDLFNRSNQTGFGTASDGQVWTPAQANDTLAIATNEGTMTGTVFNSSVWLGTLQSADFDILVRCSRSSQTNSATGVLARAISNGTYYAARLRAGNLELIKSVNGANTILASVAYSVILGSFDWLRFHLVGSTLSGKAWADNGTADPSSEPPAWMVTITDTSIAGTGHYGLVSTLSTNGDIASYDNFTADNLLLPAPPWRSPNPYGLTIGITNKNPPAPLYAYWSYLFSDMRTMGLTKLRFQLSANLIWLNQGDDPSLWSWGPLDDAVARCNAEQVKLNFPIRQLPTWCHLNTAQQTNTDSPPHIQTDPTLTAYFAQQVATRYNGQNGHGFLDTIEIGNEDFNIVHTGPGLHGLNNSPFAEYNAVSVPTVFGIEPSRDPHFFAPVLAAVGPAIRAASPSAKIVLCAIWWRQHPNTVDFLTGMYNECPGASALFDAANLHYYSNTADPNTDGSGTTYSPSLKQALLDMYGVLAAHGDGNKKIRITEIGWSTNTNAGNTIDCDVPTQAARYLASYLALMGTGVVEEVDFFTLNYSTQNRATPPKATTQSASLVQWDIPTQKYIQLPAYSIVSQFVASYPQLTATTTTVTVQAPGWDGRIQAGGEG